MADPAPHNIKIRRGDDFRLFFKVRTPGGGPYVDLTGWSGRAQIREAATSPDPPAASFTVTILDQGVSLGGVTVELDKAVTQALTINSGVYDVELTDDNGETLTWLAGTVTVTQDVTR